ncbi:thiamine-phosphate kinase [Mobilicoccus caccae]|uniref:Thiamine-monophosphate kinase n=1 Tax=Mobilicoccus caccae TaxID=1859295 RepID=A0ABQ6ISE6_9MICO|nr:thiamine-phosphate kinase [Mobilicoccus caccae]GMA40414.1 thiamine-monophosphate kinase [Mobilicoccus caccae]
MNDSRDLRLADVSEEEVLEHIFPLLRADHGPSAATGVLVGPGDDTAWLAAPDGRFLATTDAVVLGHDWLDAWSTGADVGHKAVMQNCADIAAMGGVTTGLLVTLAAHAGTSMAWVTDLARGIGEAAREARTSVVGGDLSGADDGTVMVSITAFGTTEGRDPVLRSGARPGDVVAVAGGLGRSGAGWALLRTGRGEIAPDLVAIHRRPAPPLSEGPGAARAGAHAMIDLSDGLVRDAGRVARASGVVIDLDPAALAPHVDALTSAVGAEEALTCVLTGGEEHSLLATFAEAPDGWHVLGTVGPVDELGAGVRVGGEPRRGGGWDHFDTSR